MNESQRAVAQVRVRVLHRDVVLCVSQATLRVTVVVLWLGRCGGHTRKVSSIPQINYLTQWRSREDGRGGGGLEKSGLLCNARVFVTRASLCVRVPRVLSEAAESQRAVAQVRVRVLHRDVVLCVSQATLRVSVVVLWLGRCGGHTRKVSSLPTPRGGPHAVASPAIWTDLLGARAESPGLFVLSLSHSLECSRQWVVNPPARLRGSRRVGCQPPQARLHALLNASAASESTS